MHVGKSVIAMYLPIHNSRQLSAEEEAVLIPIACGALIISLAVLAAIIIRIFRK